MWSVNPRNASACGPAALTMPLSRQGYSGAYLARTASCWADTSPSRIRLSPLVSRKSREVSENAATSVNSARTLASRSSRVPVVVIVLRRISAICGHHVGVGVGDLRGQPEVVEDLRDLRVEPLEVGVEGLEVLAEPLAAALERGGDRVERHVEVGRLHRAQQRVEVGEHLLDLDRDLGALDGLPGLERRRPDVLPSGISSETYFSPNSVLGTIEPVTSAGICSRSRRGRGRA